MAQQARQHDMEDQLPFNVQLMKALGTDSLEEALAIAESAGIKKEDIPALLMSHGLADDAIKH